jgi:hypothetical protein
MIGQPKTRSSSQFILIITLFSHWCTTLLPQQTMQKIWAKTILLGQHKVSGLNFKLEHKNWPLLKESTNLHIWVGVVVVLGRST